MNEELLSLIPPGYRVCEECLGLGMEREHFGDFGQPCSACNGDGLVLVSIKLPYVPLRSACYAVSTLQHA